MDLDRWRKEIREHLYPSNTPFPENPKNFTEILKKSLWQCPKTDKCVMECHHRIPHEHEKYCNQHDPVNKGSECPSCVKEIAADITFFPEDFEIK